MMHNYFFFFADCTHFLSPLALRSPGGSEFPMCPWPNMWQHPGPFQVSEPLFAHRLTPPDHVNFPGASRAKERSYSDTRGRTSHRKTHNPAGWARDLLAVRWQCSYRMWQLQLYRLAAVGASPLISKQQPLFTMVSSFPLLVLLLSFLKKKKISSEPSKLLHCLPPY